MAVALPSRRVVFLVLGVMAMPVPEKLAAAELLQEAKRLPHNTPLEVAGSDTELEVERKWTFWGRRTVITKSTESAWDEAMQEIEGESGISTVPITYYVIWPLWGPMQISESVIVMSAGAKLSRPEKQKATRLGRVRRDLRNQLFQTRTGQARVTVAEMRLLAAELRRAKAALE